MNKSKYDLARGLGMCALVVVFASGCVPRNNGSRFEVTELRLVDPPQVGSHLVMSQSLLVIGPTDINWSDAAEALVAQQVVMARDGRIPDEPFGFSDDYFIVFPLPSNPPHTWLPEPSFATRIPESENQYTLRPKVTSGDAGHTTLLHDCKITIESRRPLGLLIECDPHAAPGIGGDHGGGVHYR